MKQQTRLVLTMKPNSGNETTFTYNSGSVTAVITLNKDLRASDSYSAYLYNDELMLLDFATTEEKTIIRGGRSLKMELQKPLIWIPGNYFLLLRNGSEKVFRFDIILNDNATFTVAPPRLCAFLTLEDILSSQLCEKKCQWAMLSVRPGMKQFKEKAIECAQLKLMNRFRKQLINSDGIKKSCNFVIDTRGYTMTNQALLLFRGATDMDYELNFVDCSTLYDPMLGNNPYEQLNEQFIQPTSSDNALQIELPVGKTRMYSLGNISALLENGGKQILKRIRKKTSDLIITGTQSEIDSLFEQNPSLRDLFPKENFIRIEPFTLKEIILWFFKRTSIHDLFFSAEAKDWMCHKLAKAYDEGLLAHWTLKDIDNFVLKNVQPNYCRRLTNTILSQKMDFSELQVLVEDIDSKPLTERVSTYDDALEELNGMIGLGDIKRSLTTIANNMNLFSKRADLGLHNSGKTAHHAIFMGNPGTGKTTVAGLLGKIYHSLGLLSRGDVIRVDRTHIIGKFIGDTEDNMKQILNEARGNVLFIDEAYTLYSNEGCNDFGRRAVECLLNVLTQKNPDILIIFAGYQEEMDRLMSMNPGLVSRFPYKFVFNDYTADELMQIAQSLLRKDDYVLTDDAAVLLRKAIADILSEKIKNFGNARWVEQLVHNGIIPAMANRLASTPHPFTREAYQLIEASDVKRAYEQFNSKTIELKPRRQVGFSA